MHACLLAYFNASERVDISHAHDVDLAVRREGIRV